VGVALGISLLSHFHASPLPKEKRNGQNLKDQRRRKAVQTENIGPYGEWLKFEVSYLITDEEKNAFKRLTTDDEREQFIESFWERRSPDPGSPENAFKEEYYRRIAFANQAFSAWIRGWRTDRGRIYIQYGPPDEIDSYPNGGTLNAGDENGSPQHVEFPFEEWKFRYIDGLGTNVVLDFIDSTKMGEYHLTFGPTITVNHLRAFCTDRFKFDSGCDPLQPTGGAIKEPRQDRSANPAARVDLYVGASNPPYIRFKDLQAVLLSQLSERNIHFSTDLSFVPATEETVLTAVTIQVPRRQLRFQNYEGAMHGGLKIYGQFSTPSGRFVSIFEKELTLDAPAAETQRRPGGHITFQKVVPLRPGLYKLSLVIADTMSGKMSSTNAGIRIPPFDGEPSASSLILADKVELLSATDTGQEPFVIGGARIIPNICREFNRNQDLEVYAQISGLALAPPTKKPSVSVQYAVLRDDQIIMEQPEDPAKLAQATVVYTIDKKIPLKSLEPGKYSLRVTVTDKVTKRTISPTAMFRVIRPPQQ
jgi:GWxTD domain-containing protein